MSTVCITVIFRKFVQDGWSNYQNISMHAYLLLDLPFILCSCCYTDKCNCQCKMSYNTNNDKFIVYNYII